MRRRFSKLVREARKVGVWSAVVLLVLGLLGWLPGLDDGMPDKPSWSKCGLDLCRCVIPEIQVPVCPLCPGYDGEDPTIRATFVRAPKLQTPLSLAACSLGLLVVLGVRKDRPTEPERDLHALPDDEVQPGCRLGPIDPPPPRA